jgi:hypothetical protein
MLGQSRRCEARTRIVGVLECVGCEVWREWPVVFAELPRFPSQQLDNGHILRIVAFPADEG